MKQKSAFRTLGACFLVLFLVFTLLILFVDVQPIGPKESAVGFATLNGALHERIGYRPFWEKLTDILGYAALLLVFVFAVTGLVQWISRKRFFAVDSGILLLGVFYAIVGVIYVLFDAFPLNFRPVLLTEELEASYPSSHTILAVFVFCSAGLYWHRVLKNKTLFAIILVALSVATILTVVGRFISGVHWATDIVGGILLSAGLVFLYGFLDALMAEQKKEIA